MDKVFNLVMNEKELKQFCIERICELGDKLIKTSNKTLEGGYFETLESNYLNGKIDGYREVLRSLSVEFSDRIVDLSWKVISKGGHE